MLFQAETLSVEKDTDGSAFLKIDVPGRSVNVLSRAVLRDLTAALDRIEREPTLPLLTIRSGKATGFLAGADLHEFLDIRDEESARAISAQGQDLFARISRLPCPVIAAIAGPCLGGGLELALACDYRLVFARPGTRLGLPEVTLGLLPAWGGTQRLPRLIGLERALALIVGGKRLSAEEALRWGLVDAVATSEGELRTRYAEMTRRAIIQGKRVITRPERRSWRQWFLEGFSVGRRVLLNAAERELRRRVPEDFTAPLEAFAATSIGATQGETAGLEHERQAAGRLAVSLPCRRLIGVFFAQEAARKVPAELAHADNVTVQRVGIVGAGAMGAGIAQLAALRGCEVIVQEADPEALGAGLLRIQKLFEQAISSGIIDPAEGLRRFASIKGGSEWKGFDNVQVVIEAASENLELKQRLFRELETRTRADCALATNTSSLSVADIAGAVSRPERVAGLHFFNPVHKVPLVELVRVPQTTPATLARLTNFALGLGKIPLRVRDNPGFVVNRVLGPYLAEAVRLVGEGLAITVIDEEMRHFGMPVGPLELLDTIGLDVAEAVAQSLRPILGERLPASDALERMRLNDWLGQKTGRGFYAHGGRKIRYNHLAENLLRQGQPASPMQRLTLATRRADARERMVLLMVNEAVRCVSESLADSPEDVDLALILGAGWAPHRGGPLHHADDVGLAAIVERCRVLVERHGTRFAPCEGLVAQAEANRRFTQDRPQ